MIIEGCTQVSTFTARSELYPTFPTRIVSWCTIMALTPMPREVRCVGPENRFDKIDKIAKLTGKKIHM
jgi:hypothetical protein